MNPTLEDALILACVVHKGQRDKAGQPYILHPIRVLQNLGAAATEGERIVALLHDVIEDAGLKIEALRAMGYSEDVLQALDGMTKRDGEDYDAFVQRAALHPISRRVKIADITDNMDLSRIANPQPKDFARIEKYRRALEFLNRGDGN